MNPLVRRIRRSHHRNRVLATVLATGGLLAAAMIGASAASAAPSASLVYSVDGGTTWTTTPTLSSGQNVLVRQYYNNDTAGGTTGASVTATIPAGFARVPNTTQVCLNPGTTDPTHPTSEMVCNTSTGQGGAINESAVWSGANLTISPTAGVYGQPTNATSGVLAMGKKAYLSIGNCAYYTGADVYDTSIATLTNGSAAGATGASNTPAAGPNCGNGNGTPLLSDTYGWNNVQNISLLGNRYVNLANCAYYSGADVYNTSIATLTNGSAAGATGASNTPATSPNCQTSGIPLLSDTYGWNGVQSMDVLTNRYVNLANCAYYSGADVYNTSIANLPNGSNAGATGASTTPAATPNCQANATPLLSDTYGWNNVQNVDLLDQTRGQGFVQFQMAAPVVSTTTTFPQTGGLTGPGTGDPTSAANVTVTAAIGTPLLTAGPTGIGAIAALGALFAMVVAWRRRAHR